MYILIRTLVYKKARRGQDCYDTEPQKQYQYHSKKLKRGWDKKHLQSKYHTAIFLIFKPVV